MHRVGRGGWIPDPNCEYPKRKSPYWFTAMDGKAYQLTPAASSMRPPSANWEGAPAERAAVSLVHWTEFRMVGLVSRMLCV